MDEIFDYCVRLLENGAEFFGTTYKAINVWIFCIIEPIIFLLMLYIIIRQSRKLNEFKQNSPEHTTKSNLELSLSEQQDQTLV